MSRRKIVLDPGHGGQDRANRGPTGYIEADGVLDIALRLKPLLTKVFDVYLTREVDTTVPLYDRAKIANDWGVDLLISIHTNANSSAAQGIETFHSKIGEWGGLFHDEAKYIAQFVQEELVKATGLRDRGIKTRIIDRKDSPLYGMDYYAVIRRAKCPAIIIEAGFHSNPREEALLKTTDFRQKIAEAIALGLKKAYKEDDQDRLTFIIGEATATREQARAWLQQKAPDWGFLVDLYWDIASEYRIRPDIALCQACKETGFFRFGGIVQPWQNNFCGLGATGQVSDGNTPLLGADPNRVRFQKEVHGAIFIDRATGVEAHIQHLFAYATKENLPGGKVLLSPRFNLVKRGSAQYVEHLGAAENPSGVGWAYPGVDYGKSIVRDYLDRLLVYVAPPSPPPLNPEQTETIRELQSQVKQLQQELNQNQNELARYRQAVAAIQETVREL
ncbi:MAG: hypothetical protein GX295_03960 [Syntrophomonadaceae bacterium]|nr:hypothetical protein [Syntrophomonadaceae bacterium]